MGLWIAELLYSGVTGFDMVQVAACSSDIPLPRLMYITSGMQFQWRLDDNVWGYDYPQLVDPIVNWFTHFELSEYA